MDGGSSKGLAATVFGLTGFFITPAMIFWGSAFDRIGREWAYTFGSLCMILGVIFLLVARGPSQVWWLYVVAFFFALGFASRQSLIPTIAADLFHGPNFGAIYGVMSVFVAASTGMGPWLSGYLFDLFGSYAGAFCMAILMTFLSIVLFWVAGPRKIWGLQG